jgi:dihydroorotase
VAHDLLLKNGHVLDPGQGIDARLDIAVDGGVIVAMEADIPADRADRVLDVSGSGRYVVPGLVDIHTHVAHGATTKGVGMPCCVPDEIGVQSGVTTVLDAGSVGIANMGVFPEHILPRARTRVICFVNVGTHAHTTPDMSDVRYAADIDADGIAKCVEANPGLVSGIKLRLVGPYVREAGEQVIAGAKKAARAASVPLMVHIGDLFAPDDQAVAARMLELTEVLLGELERGDILTHLCTPNAGGVETAADRLTPILTAARERGVVLDSALGMGNFGYRVAAAQYERGLHPDTISSDLTFGGQVFHSLMECMAKFMAVGYSFEDVVRMTTANAAAAIGHADTLGALTVGREADITVLDVVEGDFVFTDTKKETFSGNWGITPVQTVRAGQLYAPRWGTHPWGWLPESKEAR